MKQIIKPIATNNMSNTCSQRLKKTSLAADTVARDF